jgi:hypothetical protein
VYGYVGLCPVQALDELDDLFRQVPRKNLDLLKSLMPGPFQLMQKNWLIS